MPAWVPRILLVDEDPMLLEAARAFFSLRASSWEVGLVRSLAEAEAWLAQGPAAVVAARLQLGSELGERALQLAHQQCPAATRVVISTPREREALLRVTRLAHQFVSYPLDFPSFSVLLGRLLALQERLQNPTVQAALGRVDRLPALPRVYTRLVSELDSGTATAARIAGILSQDARMAAKVLQLVNSSIFGFPRKITTLEQAVVYLGSSTLKHLTLSVGVFLPTSKAQEMEALQAHGLQVAHVARWLAQDPSMGEEAFLAGLLHPLGTLLLGGRTIEGVSQEDAGAYLLGVWGLPFSIVEAVAFHRQPWVLPSTQPRVLGWVHLAERLVHAWEGDPLPETPAFHDWLVRLNLEQVWEEWKEEPAGWQKAHVA